MFPLCALDEKNVDSNNLHFLYSFLTNSIFFIHKVREIFSSADLLVKSIALSFDMQLKLFNWSAIPCQKNNLDMTV